MTARLRRETAIGKCAFLLSASLIGANGCSGTDATPAGAGGNGVGGATVIAASGGNAPAMGGAAATGGTTSSQASPTGGKAPTGGSQSSTSSAPTGGANTGGVAATGGRTQTGGANTGGALTGGTSAVGGTSSSATGGKANGGNSAVGGTSSATGGSANGGNSAVGGTSTSGGASGNRSPGCGKAINRPNPKTQQTIDIQGTTRYYLLDVPTAADNQTPLTLIFALHGYDMNNVSVTGLYNFTSRSNGKAITVYPQGEGPAPGDTSHWGDGVLKSTWTGNTANYTFIQTLMADLESRFCIDPSRVFITGFSMGGMFTNSIACAHSDWFRGFAPVEGAGPGSCSNANAKPAIMIHQGTTDTTVSPTTGGEPTRDFWVKQNGCTQTTTSTFTGCQTYSACAQPVIYCVGNWGHTITSTATANIWGFFSGLP